MEYNLIDLFAGIGGLSTGFEKSGFKVVLANEIDEDISKSYRTNNPETLMVNCPIEQLSEYLTKNQVVLPTVFGIIGGPPCQGFSSAGKRHRKDFVNDPRNYLFREYIKIIQIYEPEFFIMENVPGLLSMEGGEIFEEIKETFADADNFKNGKYNLSYTVVSATDFGVPQTRKRLIIIGSKAPAIDLEKAIKEYQKECNIQTTTVFDAISDLNYLNANEGAVESEYLLPAQTEYQKARRGDNKKLTNHNAFDHKKNIIERIKKIKPDQNFKHLNEEIKSVHSGSYGRLSWDKPAPTITTRFDTPSAGRVIHPELNRVLTPREAARIQSFDDDMTFYGTKSIICRQIGNAVPPLLAKGLAYIVKNKILKL